MPIVHSYILSTAYLAPIEYYTKLAQGDCLIEREEHYQKQTYRNRCHIASPNGVLPLSIPVEKTGEKCCTKDMRISKHSDWQTLHWRAIMTAYNSTPFFEYYEDDLRPFYEKEWQFLFDFNNEIQLKIIELLDINTNICFTTDYKHEYTDAIDLRNSISPRQQQNNSDFEAKPYYQVFDQKFGFLPNLSIIDLLFNMGNEAKLWLA